MKRPIANLLSQATFWLLVGLGVPTGAQDVDFVRDIKPLLAKRCYACHGPDEGEGGLRLHQLESAMAELESGEFAIVPGDVESSALLQRVSDEDEFFRMPPEGDALKPDEIAALQAWIKQGAPWQQHWAFSPPEPQSPPATEAEGWVRNPIDAFILSKLESAELHPAPEAGRRTLARRAYFTVTGLPPTVEQLQEFLTDERPDAYERLVDQLLQSPHYGEHWARHWLDLVRFAESNSFERDALKPFAWKYRDYVIRSLNGDKPYDEFVREQLAGDELDEVTADSITATGYYRLGIWDDEPADPLQAKYDELDDILSTTGQVFLGLTVGCARCHDHKIDPFPQADYYGMLAFFADVTPYASPQVRDPAVNSLWDMSPPAVAQRRSELRTEKRRVRRQKISMEEVGVKRMTAPDQRRSEGPERQALLDEKLETFLNESEWLQYERTLARLEEIDAEIQSLPRGERLLSLARCEPHPDPMHIHLRGSPHAPGDEVAPHFPEIFGGQTPEIPPAAEDARSAGRRRVLADWIASPENMLTARVIANRVWQHHFGRGIVRSTNNFGELGDPPTHPELLDWLAQWLVEHDWQLKPLHQLIMTSAAYRMSSSADQQALALDPTNDLFWRFDMRRLAAEEIRDATLVASGSFNPKMFGPSFYSDIADEVLATQSRPGEGWGESTPEERSRRSVYIHVKRSLVTPLLTAFDFPDTDGTCDARFMTIQPGQALSMINGKFFNEQAGRLAQRVRHDAGNDRRRQVALALQYTIGRQPDEAEIAEGLRLLETLIQRHDKTPDEALRYWCLTALNLNEFIFLD